MSKAKGVDRLGIVPHSTERGGAGKLIYQPPLNNIGILKFIDEKVVEAFPVLLPHFGMVLKELQPAQEQVIEIEGVALFFSLLVKRCQFLDNRIVIKAKRILLPEDLT